MMPLVIVDATAMAQSSNCRGVGWIKCTGFLFLTLPAEGASLVSDYVPGLAYTLSDAIWWSECPVISFSVSVTTCVAGTVTAIPSWGGTLPWPASPWELSGCSN